MSPQGTRSSCLRKQLLTLRQQVRPEVLSHTGRIKVALAALAWARRTNRCREVPGVMAVATKVAASGARLIQATMATSGMDSVAIKAR